MTWWFGCSCVQNVQVLNSRFVFFRNCIKFRSSDNSFEQARALSRLEPAQNCCRAESFVSRRRLSERSGSSKTRTDSSSSTRRVRRGCAAHCAPGSFSVFNLRQDDNIVVSKVEKSSGFLLLHSKKEHSQLNPPARLCRRHTDGVITSEQPRSPSDDSG